VNARLNAVAISVGVIAGLLAFDIASKRSANFDPLAVGLGQNTFSKLARSESQSISAIKDPLELLPASRSAESQKKDVYLWMGASQLHSINFLEPGDLLAVEEANRLRSQRSEAGIYLQYSFPNSSFRGLLVDYLVLRREGVRPRALVLAMTYDDLREGVQQTTKPRLERADIPKILAGDSEGLLDWVFTSAEEEPAEQNSGSSNVTEGTLQERLEAVLVGNLSRAWPAYGERESLHGVLRVVVMSAFHGAFGSMMARRAPSVPEDAKAANSRALWALVKVALADGVSVYMYKQPHRPGDGDFYHERERYDAWHSELAARAEETASLYYADFEGIVPKELWGLTNEGRPDCFHFRAEGHQILGKAVEGWIEKIEESR